MTSVGAVIHNRGGGGGGALISKNGALIYKNTFEGGRLFGRGRLLEGGAKSNHYGI